MKERREERRFDVRWYLRAGHRVYGCVFGHTINVSASGLLFVTPKRYEVDSLVEMEIALGVTRFVRCIAQIVREHPASGGQYAYGAIFHSFHDQDREIYAETLLAMLRNDLGEAYKRAPQKRKTEPAVHRLPLSSTPAKV